MYNKINIHFKKVKKYLLLIILIPLLISGCLNYEQITTVKADNSGKMFLHYWTKISLPLDSVFYRQVSIFDTAYVHKQFSKKFLSLSDLESYIDYSDSTIHTKIEFNFTNLDSLNKLPGFRSASIFIKKGPEGTRIFGQSILPFFFQFGFNPENYFLKYVYYLPGNIISSNADDVTLNRLTWNFRMDKVKPGTSLKATFKPFRLAETPPWIYWLAGIVLLIVFVFLIKKK